MHDARKGEDQSAEEDAGVYLHARPIDGERGICFGANYETATEAMGDADWAEGHGDYVVVYAPDGKQVRDAEEARWRDSLNG